MDKIEMSLDDIIKNNKKSKIGAKGGKRRVNPTVGGGFKKSPRKPNGAGGIIKGRGRGGIVRQKYIRGDVNSAWKHDMYEGARKSAAFAPVSVGIASRALGSKLVVSNLDFGVSENDINELFAEFGPLKSASVHYDRSGRSLGTADVVFERRNDALKAMKTYNGVPLDGRAMNIQMATSEIPIVKPATFNTNRPQIRGTQRKGTIKQRTGGFKRGGAPQQRGGRIGGAGGRLKKEEVTIDQLNAELDAYTMQA